MEEKKKIKMLVIPSDRFGCGAYRSVGPHVWIGQHYSDEFDVDVVYSMPNENLESFFKQYDLVHIHKQLDKEGRIIDLLNFLEIPVVVDIDDHFFLGYDHPMSLTAKKEKWHEPIINHLRKATYVTTTTKIFAKTLRKYNKNVAIFPNAMDPNEKQFALPKTPETDRLRVGIICGSSHWKDIELLDGIAKQIDLDKVQFVLCGFDTNGTRTIYHQDTGEVETRPILPEESVWCEYEKVFTDNYNNVSQAHKDFLMKYMAKVDDPFTNEPYRRMWTRPIEEYATHYANVDVLIAPLKENEFNGMKCIVGNSIVSTDKGLLRISDIVEKKIEVNVENGNEFKKVVNYFKYPNEKTIKLVTRDGYRIEGTPTHRLMVDGEWKMIGDFKIGDKISLAKPNIVSNEYQHLSYPMLLTKNTENKQVECDDDMIPKIKVNEKWGRLFGYLLGDGCYKSNGFSISCDKRYEDVVEDVSHLMKSIGLKPIISQKKPDRRCNNSRCKEGFGVDVVTCSKTFTLLAKKYGLVTRDRKKEFHVPEFILKSPKSVIKEFLMGLFEADGTVSENSSVSFTTKSEDLAFEIQYLLLCFGITSHISRVYNKYYNRYYYTLSLRKDGSKLFKEEIGFVSSEKNRKLNEFVSRRDSNHHIDNTFEDEVVSIEESFSDVYDIEVEDVHLFNSNGIISHNSELKEAECGFTNTAFIGQNFGAYTINLVPMIEKGGKINENGTALLVDSSKNHKQWAKYINKLANDRDMLHKLQKNLHEFVMANYTLEKVCAERVKLYRKIVEDARASKS